jgi:3-methylfumaryl-CoA hydratase
VNDIIERTEILLPGPARALAALLDLPVPDLEGGAGLPLLWHWVYLLDWPRQADLGPDGHPVRGAVPAPPGPGQRRMWAGGRVVTSGALRCGEPATRRTSVLSVQPKEGKSGPLTFVAIQHQTWQGGRLVVDEQQDLVYRRPAPVGRPAGIPADDGPVVPLAPGERATEISPSLLFRFSALTHNAHRIHYDRDYARDVEGYPGLLTHGPLQALSMAEAVRAAGYFAGPHESENLSFSYRLTAPLFDHQGMIVSARRDQDTVVVAARDVHGRQTAGGTLRSTR